MVLHATTVAVDGRGVMILGQSGTGKSALALQLITLGAVLVADDRTHIESTPAGLVASAPETIAGLIEARGVGLIDVPVAGSTTLHLVIDLDQIEMERLPQPHTHHVLDRDLPCLHNADSAHFPSAIMLYMKAKGRTPT